MLGVLNPNIRLSETCRDNCSPGEWQGHLDGVELDGSGWLWDCRGDTDKEVEGNECGSFAGYGHDKVDDSANSFTYRVIHK